MASVEIFSHSVNFSPFRLGPGAPTVTPRRSEVNPLSTHYTKSQFLTVAEVAKALRISNMTVYRLISSSQLPAVRVGKSYRLREEDVDRYLAQRFTEAG